MENEIKVTNTRKTTSITIKKEDNAGNALRGAEFKIYSLGADGNAEPTLVTTLKVGENTLTDGVISMANITEITVSNLPSGVYRLVETHAPDGFIPANDIDFTLDASGETAEITLTGTGRTDVSVSGDTLTVKTTPGVELPSTGGSGTNQFYLLGSMLVLFAGIALLISRKRRNGI